jgi:hypothetical protein
MKLLQSINQLSDRELIEQIQILSLDGNLLIDILDLIQQVIERSPSPKGERPYGLCMLDRVSVVELHSLTPSPRQIRLILIAPLPSGGGNGFQNGVTEIL